MNTAVLRVFMLMNTKQVEYSYSRIQHKLMYSCHDYLFMRPRTVPHTGDPTPTRSHPAALLLGFALPLCPDTMLTVFLRWMMLILLKGMMLLR